MSNKTEDDLEQALADHAKDIAFLRQRVTELQADNTRLVEERRAVDIDVNVRHFMRLMGQEVFPSPRVPEEKVVRLRLKLVAEEFFELLDAVLVTSSGESTIPEADRERIFTAIRLDPIHVNMVEIADACADIDYVVAGARAAFGIDGRPVAKLVHESNCRKAGGPRRADGKVMKPADWVPPDIGAELRRQGWRP